MLIDVHAHLDYEENLKNIEVIIENAKKAKVTTIVNNGLNPKSNRTTLELSKKYSIVKPALGLYPTDALLLSDEKIDEELKFIKHQKPIAIGECGLDFSDKADVNFENTKKRQIDIFRKHILLAKSLDIPIIVHSRKAEKEVIEILKKESAKKVVLHCFSGKKSLISEAIKEGYCFSIPANVLRSTHFQELVRMVPITQILTETDFPFLSPVKEKPNEPANIALSISKIADLKNMTKEEVINSVYMTFQKLFL